MSSREPSYRELVQSANTIVLRWDLQGRITFLNDFGLEFFGWELGELVGRSVVGTIVPETETSGRDLVQMIDDLLRQPDRFVNNENENMRRGGERVWVTWRNRALDDEEGRTRELLSIGIDTTDRKRAEEALRDSERRYRALFQSMPIALIERDASELKEYLDELRRGGVSDVEAYLRVHPAALAQCLHLVRVTDMNAAARQLLDTREMTDLDSYPHVADASAFTNLVRAIIADVASGVLNSQQREGLVRTRAGVERNVMSRTTVVPPVARELGDSSPAAARGTSILTALVDITEAKKAEEALRASEERFRFLAEHDNLTGLFNRRYLYQVLTTLLQPGHSLCSVLFMDLDRFKRVVDTYGHLNGSRVIQEVAQVIGGCVAEPAFSVAYAGDEFVVVLPGWDKAQAVEMANAIQTAIRERVFLADEDPPVHLTASIGVATYPFDAEDMEDLLAVADRALFAAKQHGRNSVVAAG